MRKRAFTLTEVLLAIAIVGIIAALILPATLSRFNDKLIDNAHDRLLKSINTSLDTLSITENRSGFMSTMMYVIIDNGDYEYTSGKFLKKYLRVAKYCGNSNGKCFADKYYEYKDNKKLEFSPTYKGGCAVLKSGASICLEPQVGANAIKGLIDINGSKGPNVLTRDLREITISPRIHQVSNKSTEAVITTPIEIHKLEDTNICETNPESLACCETLTGADITSPAHACCAYAVDLGEYYEQVCSGCSFRVTCSEPQYIKTLSFPTRNLSFNLYAPRCVILDNTCDGSANTPGGVSINMYVDSVCSCPISNDREFNVGTTSASLSPSNPWPNSYWFSSSSVAPVTHYNGMMITNQACSCVYDLSSNTNSIVRTSSNGKSLSIKSTELNDVTFFATVQGGLIKE